MVCGKSVLLFYFRSSFPDLAVNVGFHYLGGEAFGTLFPCLFNIIFHYLKAFFFLLFVLRHWRRSLPEESVPLKANPMPASKKAEEDVQSWNEKKEAWQIESGWW